MADGGLSVDEEVEAGRLDALAGYPAEDDASPGYLEGFVAGQLEATGGARGENDRARFSLAEWPEFIEARAARKRVFWRLAGEQNWRCCYCGIRMSDPRESHPNDPTQATLEHLKPRSAGGSHEPENLAVACRGCNGRRGSMPLLAFLRLLVAERA